MNKWIYRIFGLAIVVFSILLFIWFFTDFAYGITHITNPMYFARIASPFASLYLGLFYLYYGMKKEKINKYSNASIWTLILTLIITLILMIFSSMPVGREAPNYMIILDMIWRALLPIGIVITLLLSLVSIFKNK